MDIWCIGLWKKHGLFLVTPNWHNLGGQAECKFGKCTNSPNLGPDDERTPLLVSAGKKQITLSLKLSIEALRGLLFFGPKNSNSYVTNFSKQTCLRGIVLIYGYPSMPLYGYVVTYICVIVKNFEDQFVNSTFSNVYVRKDS